MFPVDLSRSSNEVAAPTRLPASGKPKMFEPSVKLASVGAAFLLRDGLGESGAQGVPGLLARYECGGEEELRCWGTRSVG